MTDHEKLAKMDAIRREYGIPLESLNLLSEEDAIHDMMNFPLKETVSQIVKTENCLRSMIKTLYNIRSVEEYNNDVREQERTSSLLQTR